MSREALEYAIALGRGVLFCEDDIDLAPDFPAFLRKAAHGNVTTYFYTHEGPGIRLSHGTVLCAAIMGGVPVPSGLYSVRSPRRGTQCVFIPHTALARFPLEELHGGAPIDVALDRWLDRLGIPAFVALPNPVQHRHSRAARSEESNDIKRSISFNQVREV